MNRSERRRLQRARGTDPRLAGLELRYDGRTLLIQFLVKTTATQQELVARMERMQPLARGEKLDMVVTALKCAPAASELSFFINTDATREELSRRMREMLPHAQGAANDAAFGSLSEIAADDAPEVWDAFFRSAELAAKQIGQA